MKKEEYIQKWLDNTLSEQEFKEFRKTDDYKNLVKLDRHLQAFRAPEYKEESEYSYLQEQLKVAPKQRQIRSSPWNSIYKVAATLLLVLLSAYLYYNYTAEDVKSTYTAEHSNFLLPDSSKVWLNAVSEVSYDAKNWKEERTLLLKGEAFFDVEKGIQFDVRTENGNVKVLGTEFNVLARNDIFEVSCYEGSVQVSFGDDIKVLKPGDIFKAQKSNYQLIHKSLSTTPSWMNQISSFSSIPYQYVLEEFERQYDVSIEAKSVDTQTIFSGSFSHDDIKLALKSITEPLNLSFEIQGQKIVINRD